MGEREKGGILICYCKSKDLPLSHTPILSFIPVSAGFLRIYCFYFSFFAAANR